MKNYYPFGAILITLLIFSFTANAQTLRSNPFKPLPKPNHYSLSVTATNPTISAWRFTPMTGYNLSTNQIMAGIGYGMQWMHFVDSTQKYYTTFSVQLVGWVNGTTSPSLNPPNFASVGLTIGIFNQLIQLGAAYTPPTGSTKGQIGPVVNLAIPLNN